MENYEVPFNEIEREEEFYSGIAKRIKETREEQHLSQADLAKYVGISPAAIANYETCYRKPSIYHLKAIAWAFKKPISYLLGYDMIDRPHPAKEILNNFAISMADTVYEEVMMELDENGEEIEVKEPYHLIPVPKDYAKNTDFVLRVKDKNTKQYNYYLLDHRRVDMRKFIIKEDDLVIAYDHESDSKYHFMKYADVPPHPEETGTIDPRRRMVFAVVVARLERLVK